MTCAVRSLVSLTMSVRRLAASRQRACATPSGDSIWELTILSAVTMSCVEDWFMLFLFVDYDAVALGVGEFD
jgi:hypothetical protein